MSLPIFNKVIFTDWHGVLSHDYFWMNTLSGQRVNKDFRSSLLELRHNIFNSQTDLIYQWMRGELESANVLRVAACSQSIEFINFAAERLERDCEKMTADETLLRLYREIRLSAWVVVATDNMDCFVKAFVSKQSIKTHFDDIICSSDIGVLKSENPTAFFGNWLKNYGLSFRDALLIDDSLSNCEAFVKAGGSSLLFTSSQDIEDRLRNFVSKNDSASANVVYEPFSAVQVSR